MSPKRQLRSLADDLYLAPYSDAIARRHQQLLARCRQLTGKSDPAAVANWAAAHEYYGLHRQPDGGWVFREWAPNAERAWLVGDTSDWRRRQEFEMQRGRAQGDWELFLSADSLRHGTHFLIDFDWPGGSGQRVPAYARYVIQDPQTKLFSAMVWAPEQPYQWRNSAPPPTPPLIYEAHVGMATEEPKVGSFDEFRTDILPRIVRDGYNTVQLMAVMGHPYYGSFGYHVANFFSIAGRFGTPEEFKHLVDAAHGMGLRVIIDLVHSHAVKNEIEGLSRFDGTEYQYFHRGARGEHSAWDSRCFNYDKPQVLHFLLSNCRFWLDEYHLDGFRFDGVTSMLYDHHGLGKTFTGYSDYFCQEVDEDAYIYLGLANSVIHTVNPEAITIAEDVSGMAGLGAPVSAGGCGFDYRLAMGVTDHWFKLFDIPDEFWNMGALWHELTNHRADERVISYVECHDQGIVGGQTAIFRMIGAAMYDSMANSTSNLVVDRGVALHKMARLLTAATAGDGYLNFMGNEFGHPEWIDFPREGNQWSSWYARRQWSLAERDDLRFSRLGAFDRAMIELLKAQRIYEFEPQKLKIDDQQKVIAFERGGLWFFANFHPTQSLSDWRIPVLPGSYDLVLSSDALEFGGFNRVPAHQHYQASASIAAGECKWELALYLPCRTILVLARNAAKRACPPSNAHV